MANNSISGYLFRQMVTNGAVNLKNNHKEIDHLNVFPVPDGDTGTNMQMTMMAGVKEVSNLKESSITDISKILSKGLLMGARGNSGVILSQFFRGVSTEISKNENQNELTVSQFIDCLVGGYQMAYRAVMDPVEGTILTVVREAAEKIKQERNNLNSIEEVMDLYVKQAKLTLLKTPELLPVLKEAGVVDSGGAGFLKIIEGMQMALQGNILSENINHVPILENLNQEINHGFVDLHNIKFGYCTEFITRLFSPERFKEEMILSPLKTLGDSMVVAVSEDLLKVHIHTNQPGVIITLAQKYGEIQTIKVENMRRQNQEVVEQEKEKLAKISKVNQEKTKYSIIAVASGEGMKQVFLDLGVDYIVDGGQTMNPSTEDFLNVITNINSDNIIIIPNNKNIIMAAEQTIDLCPDKNIQVLKTKNISQGYASLMVFDPTADLEENLDLMSEQVNEVKSGEVTYAVRETTVNGVEINKNDYIGILNDKIKLSTNNLSKTTKQLLKEMISDDSELVTIFYGKDILEKDAVKMKEYVLNLSEDVEVEVVAGMQDVYSYIISVI